jgi:hypothetical protein
LVPGDDLEDLAARECDALPAGDHPRSLGANRKARTRPGQRNPHRVGGDFEGRSAEQNFERRASKGIADKCVGKPQAETVERAGNRDADRLVAGPAKILHRGVQTRRQHLQSGGHSAIGSPGTW